MAKLGVGVIGCGHMGSSLARSVGKAGPPAAVVATCDLIKECRDSLAAELGAESVATSEELLARDDVDAVIVAIPNNLHPSMVIAAAKAGKHVFSEKPMALQPTDCTAMIDACREAGVKLMVGQVLRYIGAFKLIREAVDRGDIGEPWSLSITRTGVPNYGDAKREWRMSDEQSGGVLFEVNVHELDFIRTILGEPEEVYTAAAKFLPQSDGDYEDINSVTARFAGGRVGHLLAGNCSPGGTYFGLVHGSEGEIEFHGFSSITLRRFGEEPKEISPAEGGPAPTAAELGDFATAIAEDGEPAVPGEEGRRSVAYARAAVMSAREGRPVKLSELL